MDLKTESQMHGAKTRELKGKQRISSNGSPLSVTDKINKEVGVLSITLSHLDSTDFNRHLKDSPLRIYMFFKCMLNILQNRPNARS